MNIIFCLYTLIILMFYKFSYKYELNKPLSFLLLCMFITFYTPVVYYVLMEGDSYKFFDEASLVIFMMIGLVLFFEIAVLSIYYRNKRRIKHNYNFIESNCFNIYISLIIFLITTYIFMEWDKFLIFKIINETDNDLTRSDISGVLPYWYTISSILMIIVPSIYFYVIERYNMGFGKHILFILLCMVLMIDGNRGVCVYLCFFYLLFILKKNKLFLLAAFPSTLFIYAYFKGIKYFDFDVISLVIDGAVRRLFVTQSACFINRIYLNEEGYYFDQDSRISDEIFHYIFGVYGGSAPTMFMGDLILQYGYVIAFIVTFLIIWLLVYLSHIIQYDYNNKFICWNYCIVVFMLFMSELSLSHFYRIVLAFMNCIIFIALVRKVKSENST